MWKFWIDTGGTFTDCIAQSPNGETMRVKTLSSSALRGHVHGRVGPRAYRVATAQPVKDGFYTGYVFRALRAEGAESASVMSWDAEDCIVKLDTDLGEMEAGTLCEFQSPEEPPTLAARILTRRRLDEALPRLEMRLATTRGTNALLERKGAKTAFVVTKGFGDLIRIGNQQRPDLFAVGIRKPEPLHERVFELDERLDAQGGSLREPDIEGLKAFAREALADGVVSFAVALLHSYRNPAHEREAARALTEVGARYVSVSSELAPFAKLLPRGETTVVDGYLSPIMESYLNAVSSVLEDGDGESEGAPALRVMTSAGGLVSRRSYRAKDSLLSGPAGGVVGSSRSGLQCGCERTIAFDMGGTSTDVSRFDGQLDYRFEQRIGAARVYAPSLRIETVAAGGGSICWFDGTALRVGPESAGASPGPACYGAGGPLAITDVNLLLGRLDVSKFGIPVYPDAAEKRLTELQEKIREATGEAVEREELLLGFLRIANETMAEAIRKISTSEGYDPSGYGLVAFGGAGGMHACAIASILDMDRIVFPADAGLLSAFGLKHAQVEQFAERQVLRLLSDCVEDVDTWARELEGQAAERLRADGVAAENVAAQPARFELRYRGQESTLVVEGVEASGLRTAFEGLYRERFGFLPDGLTIELVAMRVAARSKVSAVEPERFEAGVVEKAEEGAFLSRESLVAGTRVSGPVVIQDPYSTVYVERGWAATVGSAGTLMLERASVDERVDEGGSESGQAEVVELELFTNRFLSLVEEMGALLERAAFSTNVKDRKDFSCALLDPDGYLVANAPHIPVHLGALGVCLRTTLKTARMGPGDVVATNHPGFGGSHLPDVTLLAPVYSEDGDTLLGYVANRAHHAEIGGKRPGSMPPDARNLSEEGVVIAPLKLAENGVVDWEPLKRLLTGGQYPTRSLAENIADLSAQLASIRSGAKALQGLAEAEGTDRVFRYMGLLKQRAETALRSALEERLAGDKAEGIVRCSERLDDGASVSVAVSKGSGGKWLLDFDGTAGVQPNNYNATPAITTSAAIYALRLLAKVSVPLNEGFLDVVELSIPEGMLNPRFPAEAEDCPAVVAGNVEVSQLVVSTLLKAFGIAACSQSTMNNFIFGTDRFGYYETIAGGEGASPGSDGASGVHTHMTNTAMTDPEIMELRYPVRVERFGLRRGSGGAGRYRGGDGVEKRIRFLESVSLSLLTQRRKEPPFGMEGGAHGAVGEQWLITASGEERRLPGNGSEEVEAGSTVVILTPGGGGWGAAADGSDD